MKLYVQLTIIFTISLIGEIISDGLYLPIPGSMIGLLILFLLLQFKLLRMRHVNMVGNFLLANHLFSIKMTILTYKYQIKLVNFIIFLSLIHI